MTAEFELFPQSCSACNAPLNSFKEIYCSAICKNKDSVPLGKRQIYSDHDPFEKSPFIYPSYFDHYPEDIESGPDVDLCESASDEDYSFSEPMSPTHPLENYFRQKIPSRIHTISPLSLG